MNKPQVVIAMYRPKAGKEKELETLIHKHFPTLKEYGLTTNRDPFIGRSSDGTFLEVFEWVAADSSKQAHDHPAIGKIWEAMGAICEFTTLEQLPEAKNRFPQFQRAF